MTRNIPRTWRGEARKLLSKMYRDKGLRDPEFGRLKLLLELSQYPARATRAPLFRIGLNSHDEEVVFTYYWPPRP